MSLAEVIRTDVKDFPLIPQNPIVITWVEGQEIKHHFFNFRCVSEYAELRALLATLTKENVPYTIIGSWAGRWSTDVFKFTKEQLMLKIFELGM